MNKRLRLLCPLLTLLTAPAMAQVAGDLIVSNGTSIRFYGPGGVLNMEVPGTGPTWVASALAADGRIVINDANYFHSVRIFDSTGQYLSEFGYTPLYYSSDLDLFSDDVIAICSRLEGLLLFDDVGTQLGTLFPAGMSSPNGLQIQDDDTIWVADLMNFNNPADGRIWHLDRSGNVLHHFDTPFDPSDVAVAPNGSLWVSDYAGRLVNFDVQGNVMNEFDAQIDAADKALWSVAVADDGTVWASGYYDWKVRGYGPTGFVIYEYIDDAPNGGTAFLSVMPGITWADVICTAEGSAGICPCGNLGGSDSGCQNSIGPGASLWVGGSSSVTVDLLSLEATGMPPGQPAIAFVGSGNFSGGIGMPFGDGLRCVNGPLQRLGLRTSDGNGSAYWGAGMGSLGGWSAGETHFMQVWYGDPQGPCSTGSNATNAIEVRFIP